MNDAQIKAMSDKIDLLLRLNALQLVTDKKQDEQIILLNRAGFQPKEIAQLLGTTANTVSVRLSSLRKKTRRK